MSKYTTEELLNDVINEMESDKVNPRRKIELDLLYETLTAELGDTTIRHLFASFSEYANDGISYSLFGDANPFKDYKYLGAIVVPKLSREEVMNMGAEQIEEEIAELYVKITRKKEQKQQLLALENHSEKHSL